MMLRVGVDEEGDQSSQSTHVPLRSPLHGFGKRTDVLVRCGADQASQLQLSQDMHLINVSISKG